MAPAANTKILSDEVQELKSLLAEQKRDQENNRNSKLHIHKNNNDIHDEGLTIADSKYLAIESDTHSHECWIQQRVSRIGLHAARIQWLRKQIGGQD